MLGRKESSFPVVLRHPALLAAAVMVAFGLLALLLRYGGGAGGEPIVGLPDPGLTAWLLPAARLGGQLAAVTTIGMLLAAAVLSPRNEGRLSAVAYRRIRVARWSALVWSLCCGATVCLTLSDIVGLPVSQIVSARALANFVTSVPLGQAMAVTGLLALAAGVTCFVTVSVGGTVTALCIAVGALVPALFTGHAAAGGNHQVAISALVLHVVPVVVWAGGLLALLLTPRTRGTVLAVAVRRFSVIATWCLAAVAVSGLVSAAVRIPQLGLWWGTPYGQIALVKAQLLVALAVLGWMQRRAAIPALRAGDRRRFALVAAGEVLVFAAAMGAAAALSRTPPAVISDESDETPAQALLGFAMPEPISFARVAGDWLPEPLYLSAALVATGLYLAGVVRLRRRGDAWPVHRIVVLLAGCGLLIVATSSGIARYAPVLFSVHMGQHLVLNMVVPILLVLAAPVTLALRALRPAGDPAWPGPREWLQALLHSRALGLLSHPLVALALYAGSLYVMYFSGLYELALRSHAAHLAMVGHFLLTGYLFFSAVIGVDPSPRRTPYPLRMVLVFAAMVLHAFLGVALMLSNTPLAAEWFASLDRPWGPSPLADLRLGGGMAWSFGEVPMAIVLAALLRQWMTADEREARRRDRVADRAEAQGQEDAELAAYNAMLAGLAARDREHR
ncbi:cytochrome c oxidase assembly protein [Actinoplanes flavus]|uniref:Bifunctional copper resistance protein CopD/cytochrome c oxidase assembly protein n=1 Tax=Actinoplanes flavus TaxID=2820290 RepID=A0ABS3UCV9_9ACTN|nr:cytochrome c oxidase assembly protein [Actinoplanes flavus]MBO3736568.1 bifunctional copper resistance protein CopD/cytochrome c oxidase assembly protein [Actinoplanes flavus]